MSFIENFKMAFDSIKSNKMRSFLTMLGIIIGISSVITIVSLGAGGQHTITGEFEKIGSATVNVKVNSSKAQVNDYINFDDARVIKERIEKVKYVTPVVQKQGIVQSESKSKRAYIIGSNNDMFYINNYSMLYGRFFTENEFLEGKPTVVIDENSAKLLFGYKDVVGKTVTLGPKTAGKKATIVGVTKSENMFMSAENENIPAFLNIPATFLQTLYSNDFIIDSLSVTAVSKESTEEVGNGVKNILQNRHNNRGREIYSGENVLKQMEQINKVLGIFTAFIGAVAAISLLVGGIGVMNIMLVSVTERTREIGIRKAIGATTNAILLQFLMESVIISMLGGIIGMIIGILGAEIIGMFANIQPIVSPMAVILAILFSSAVGIFFGIYPARKAAKLNPIDALRYE